MIVIVILLSLIVYGVEWTVWYKITLKFKKL